MTDFLAMGGHAWYVWGSYGVTFLALLMEVVFLMRRSRETKT